jgi:F-type H+-transporting ATPase subunit gamma
MLTSNRGLCGGYNGAVIRAAILRRTEVTAAGTKLNFEISGKRGSSAMMFRHVSIDQTYTHFEDSPAFNQVALIADRLMEEFITGKTDRLDVVYTQFISSSKQIAVAETLLPFKQPTAAEVAAASGAEGARANYEFLPSAESILEEVVPASFRVKLFKCFLDAAVSEQIARMVAMKSATENAGDIIKQLSRTYNRARQSRITQEIMEIIGGVEALEG